MRVMSLRLRISVTTESTSCGSESGGWKVLGGRSACVWYCSTSWWYQSVSETLLSG